MNKVNDTALQHNNAAKDDCLQFGNGLYSVNDLLANDPGSAHFVQFLTAGVTYNPADGTFLVAPGVTQLQYEIQVGNGTMSIANVDVENAATLTGPDLVKNGSFEADPVSGVYQSFPSLSGWTTDAGSAQLEVVTAGYSGISGGQNTHWLDTQASPGPIDISQVLKMTSGEHAQMTFSVAAEDITAAGLATSPDEKLDFMFGGHVVKEVTMADFTATGGGTDYNNFRTFSASIVGGTDDTLRIVSHGASDNVGFAIDSVSVRQMVAAPHC
jgi:hypothetical protein